jgi:uncharacterized membrane protein
MGHSIGFLTLSIVAGLMLIGFATLWPDSGIPLWISYCLMLIPIVPIIAVSIHAGQGGCRLKPKNVEAETGGAGVKSTYSSGGRGDDKYWILGMFYFNPDDPAHVVEDRFGSNIGFNYARLPVKIGVAVLAAAVVAVYVWTTVLLLQMN